MAESVEKKEKVRRAKVVREDEWQKKASAAYSSIWVAPTT
jgi:hypothetical protein